MLTLKQHPSLTPERWRTFAPRDRILMVACEINRAVNCLNEDDSAGADNCYERAFELLDLTTSLLLEPNRLKELRRLREVIAGQYVAARKDVRVNAQALDALLHLYPDREEVRR